MILPQSKRELDDILHRNSFCEHSTREGVKFGEKYHSMRPHLAFAHVIGVVDSIRVNPRVLDAAAYKLSVLVTYMKLEGYDFPFTENGMVTSDQADDERNTTGMLNKIMLIGNLGRDPELNVTGEGTPVTRFSIAVSRNYTTQGGERREETEWFNIVAWRKLAEICDRYLTKGSKVYVEGRLTQRKYTDREGVQRTTVEVIATEMEMLTPKGGNGNGTDRKAEVDKEGSNDAFLPDYPDDLS